MLEKIEIEELKSRIKILKQEGKWDEVKKIQVKLLQMNPSDVRAVNDLVIIAKKEENWDEVRRLQTIAVQISPENIAAIYDLVHIAKREDNWEEVKRLQTIALSKRPEDLRTIADLIIFSEMKGDLAEVERLRRLILDKHPEKKEELENLVQRQNMNERKRRKTIDSATNREFETKQKIITEISELRSKLYLGEIDISQIPEIIKKYANTDRGAVFIAEVYTYFGQQRLAIKTLTKFQKDNQDSSPQTKKIIKKALDIAKGKNKIADKEKWSTTYGQSNLKGENR